MELREECIKNSLLALFHKDEMVAKSYVREKIEMAFRLGENSKNMLDFENKRVYEKLMGL